MMLNQKIDELREELIESTQELIKIKSVEEEAKEGMPFGESVAKTLDKALEISKNLGFKTVNLDGYIGYAEYGEGEDYVGILGHLDVVPEGDGWIHPAYGAEIHDGKMYGRGTMDDKGPMVAALYGLKAIKDLNLPLSKKVRIIFGTNEESGCNEMDYYLEREKPPVLGFTPDAEYPIIYGEKGIVNLKLDKDLNLKGTKGTIIKYIKGGQRPNMVPDYCEAAIDAKDYNGIMNAVEEFKAKTGYDLNAELRDDVVVIKSIGASAHGSTPELGKNAIMQMLSFLGTLEMGKCDIVDYIEFFNKYVGFETDGTTFGVGLEDKESGKLSFNVGTIVATEDKVSIVLNLRYPVTFKYEDMIKPFNKRVEGTGITVEETANSNPLFFPETHPLIQSLQKVYEEQTGQKAELIAIGGGTYAKTMPNIVAFGPTFPGKPDVIHKPNEYIVIDELILNAKIYGHAIYELAK